MLKTKVILLIAITFIMGANDSNTTSYCEVINKIKPGMDVYEVFSLLGVPTNFSIPQNLDIETIRGKNFHTEPSKSLDDKSKTLDELKKNPIFGAFADVPVDQYNNLSWSFSKDKIIINIRLRGSKVFTINSNPGC